MLEELKTFLDNHNIEYKVTYGGKDCDIENIEIGSLAILEDNGQYEVCHIPSANFMWFDFDGVVNMIMCELDVKDLAK